LTGQPERRGTGSPVQGGPQRIWPIDSGMRAATQRTMRSMPSKPMIRFGRRLKVCTKSAHRLLMGRWQLTDPSSQASRLGKGSELSGSGPWWGLLAALNDRSDTGARRGWDAQYLLYHRRDCRHHSGFVVLRPCLVIDLLTAGIAVSCLVLQGLGPAAAIIHCGEGGL